MLDTVGSCLVLQGRNTTAGIVMCSAPCRRKLNTVLFYEGVRMLEKSLGGTWTLYLYSVSYGTSLTADYLIIWVSCFLLSQAQELAIHHGSDEVKAPAVCLIWSCCESQWTSRCFWKMNPSLNRDFQCENLWNPLRINTFILDVEINR